MEQCWVVTALVLEHKLWNNNTQQGYMIHWRDMWLVVQKNYNKLSDECF